MKPCEHKYIYKVEHVRLKTHDTQMRTVFYDAKRVIIYCEKCGDIKYDRTNDCNGNQDYTIKNYAAK